MPPPVPQDADRQINTGAGKTITALRPTNLGAGERWQVGIVARDSAAGEHLLPAIVTPPTGWVLVQSRDGDLNATTHLLVYALTSTTGSEPASVDFVIDAGAAFAPENWATISDRITSAADEAFHVRNRRRSSNAQQCWDAATVTTSLADCLICYYWGFAGSQDLTIDANLDATFQAGPALNGTITTIGGGYEDQVTAGTTTVRTTCRSGGNDQRWQSNTIALAPAGASGDPPTPASIGAAEAVAPDVVRPSSVISGGNSPTGHELWVAQAPGDPFADGSVVDTFGATVPATIDVTALTPSTSYNIGIRALKTAEESADSNVVSATTLDLATWTLTHQDTLVISVGTGDETVVLLDISSVLARIGKYEDGGTGRVDFFIELENDGVIVGDWTFANVTLAPQDINQAVSPIVSPVVDPRLHITALMPEGANGQQAALYWIEAAGTVIGAPPTPQNLQVVTLSTTSQQISWDAVADVDGYRVQAVAGVSTFPEGTGALVFDSNDGGVQTSLTRNDLDPEVEYAYRVAAKRNLA